MNYGSGLAMPDSWNRARLRDLIDFLDPTWPSRCIIHDPLLSRKSTSYDVRCRKHWLLTHLKFTNKARTHTVRQVFERSTDFERIPACCWIFWCNLVEVRQFLRLWYNRLLMISNRWIRLTINRNNLICHKKNYELS